MRTLDGIAATLALAALAAAVAYLAPQGEVASGFAEVVDGDSLRLEGRSIRLAGLDAPELRQTCHVQGRPYKCGEVARRALDDMVAGHIVRCAITGRDRYGRHLASCTVGGEDVGAALVSRGFAVAYGRYRSEEAGARRQGLELWAGSFQRPSEWRKAHAGARRG